MSRIGFQTGGGLALKRLWPILAALLTLALQVSGAVSSAELLVRDALLRHLPSRSASKVAIVLIDDEAIRRAGRWPWERAQLARLVENVFSAGAKGVVMDLLLPEEREGDERLTRALGRGPSALAVGVDGTGQWLLPNRSLPAAPLGHVSFDLDRDGVVRRLSSTKQIGGRVLPALPVAAARLSDSAFPIPVGVMIRPAFRAPSIPALSAAAVLEAAGTDLLRDRIVFIGTSAAGVGDRFISPVSRGGSPDPGVLIEALSAESILSKDLLRTGSPLINALLAFGLAWLGTTLLAFPGRAFSRFAPGLVVAPLLLSAVSLQFLNLEKLVVNFDVAAGTTKDVWIDFDAAHSIQVVQAGASGQYLLRPTVWAFDKVVTGSISGKLTDATTAAALAGATVYAETLDASGNARIARTTTTDATGAYTLDLLPVGASYYVVSQPQTGTIVKAYDAKASDAFALSAASPVFTYSAAFTSDLALGGVSGGLTPVATSSQSDQVNLLAALVTPTSGTHTFIVDSTMATVGTSTETYGFTNLPAGAYSVQATRTTLNLDGTTSSTSSTVQPATVTAAATATVNLGL